MKIGWAERRDPISESTLRQNTDEYTIQKFKFLIYLLIGAHEVTFMAKVLHFNNFVFGRRTVAEIRVPSLQGGCIIYHIYYQFQYPWQ